MQGSNVFYVWVSGSNIDLSVNWYIMHYLLWLYILSNQITPSSADLQL